MPVITSLVSAGGSDGATFRITEPQGCSSGNIGVALRCDPAAASDQLYIAASVTGAWPSGYFLR